MKKIKTIISLLLLFVLLFQIETKAQSSTCTVQPKAPKVAIVSAGAYQKGCGTNTVQLNAQIPNWIEGNWGDPNVYSNMNNPNSNYTYPDIVNQGSYAIRSHIFTMKLKDIISYSNFIEETKSIFYANNQNAVISFYSNPPDTRHYYSYNNGAFGISSGLTVDGPCVYPPNLFSGGNGLFIPQYNGLYTFKSALAGCTTNFVTQNLTVTTAQSTVPSPCFQYNTYGWIEVNFEPLERFIDYPNSFNVEIYNSNGVLVNAVGAADRKFISLPIGVYYLVPLQIGAVWTPTTPPFSVTVGANTSQSITVQYQKANTGKLTVFSTVECSSELNNNSLYKIDGASQVYVSGVNNTLNNLSGGVHTIEFNHIPGYVKPQTTTITIEADKRTVVLAEYQKLPPCGITNFGFANTNSAVESAMQASENAACDVSNCLRNDYHSYILEKSLTNTSKATRDQVWNLFKTKLSNQVPLADDFVPTPGSGNIGQGVRTVLANNFLPPPAWNTNASVQSQAGQIIELFSPETFAVLTGIDCYTGNCKTWFQESSSPLLSPIVYNNPVAIHIDETNKCLTNYTLPNHILYPGRVKRCIVEECGEIKLRTYGNGHSKFGNNFLGYEISKLNEYIGTSLLFANVDNRFKSLVDQTFSNTNTNTNNNTNTAYPITAPLGIENKTWTVNQFKVKHPNFNETVLFDTSVAKDSFWNMKTLKFIFKLNGTYEATNVLNQSVSGVWSTNGLDSISTDGVKAHVNSVSSNKLIIKGIFKSFVDTTMVDAEYTFVLENSSVAAKVYLNNVDATTGLMPDYLKTEPNFPKKDPYRFAPLNSAFIHKNNNDTAQTNTTVLAINGNNSIVDWVFLELRTGNSGATSVAYTKSALLQSDGDIVDMDGVSPISFNAPSGNYYLAIRHRNHTGFRTANKLTFNGTPLALNFTNNSVTLFGATPLKNISPTVFAMNVGDSNSDGSIDAFDSILWENQNGLFDDYTKNADYNLDGSVDAFDSILWEFNNGKFEELD